MVKGQAAPKPRGRPPGSKNKPKGEGEEVVASAPKARPSAGAPTQALTEKEEQALFMQQLAKVEQALSAKKAADEALTTVYRSAKVLGFTRIDFQTAIELKKTEDKESTAKHLRFLKIAAFLNHPIGTQFDLFAAGAPDREPAEDRAEKEGFNDGAAGESCRSAYYLCSPQDRAYVRGWDKGQATLRSAMEKKMQPAPAPTPIEAAAQQSETLRQAADQAMSDLEDADPPGAGVEGDTEEGEEGEQPDPDVFDEAAHAHMDPGDVHIKRVNHQLAAQERAKQAAADVTKAAGRAKH